MDPNSDILDHYYNEDQVAYNKYCDLRALAEKICAVMRPARNVPYSYGGQSYMTPEEVVAAIIRENVPEITDAKLIDEFNRRVQ
jgi:hypothetical protein